LLETPAHPIPQRQKRASLVPYPVNPKSLARFREALHPSRSKNDPKRSANWPTSGSASSGGCGKTGSRTMRHVTCTVSNNGAWKSMRVWLPKAVN